MSKVSKDELELDTVIYAYTLKDNNNGVYELRCEKGEITELSVTGLHGNDVSYNPKIVLFDNNKRIYFQRRYDYSIYIDECFDGRVLLLSRDDERALDLFLKYEYSQLDSMQDKINKHVEKINKIRSIKEV